jgi:hypothetical protein
MHPTTIRIAILVLFSLPLLSLADVPHHSVDVLPHWKKGETFGLEITRAREKSVDGKSMLMGKTHTSFTIEVLSANDEGYLVGWTAGETRFGSSTPAAQSFLRQVADVMKGLQIVLEIDPQGTIKGVRNWKELKVAALRVMDTLLAGTLDSQHGNTDKVLVSKLRAQWESMLATKERIEELCTREARTYFMVLGRSYTKNEPYEYKALLPNPLDGDAFPAQATMALKTFDKQSGQAVIMWKQTADPHQSARILESTLTAMTERLGQNRPEREFPKTIAMQDNAEVVVDVATGWVETLTIVRSMHLGARAQLDTTSIVRTAK